MLNGLLYSVLHPQSKQLNMFRKVQQNFELYLNKCKNIYNNIPVICIFECFHVQHYSQHLEKPSLKYQTHNLQNGQIFFLLISSDKLAQHCLNLSRWFSHETTAFSTEQGNVPFCANADVRESANF